MKKHCGFTLIELIIFLIILAILATTVLLGLSTSIKKTGTVTYNDIANQTAAQCIEAFVGQRRMNGYTGSFSTACPNTPTLPTICSAPSGYTVSAAITCGPTIGSDSTYKTLTVTVNGPDSTKATLQYLIASY